MAETNFDLPIDRSQSDSYKWRKYGPDILPLWIADMDFPSPEPVIQALRQRVEHGIYGYPPGLYNFPDELPEFRSLIVERMAERYQWRIQPQDMLLLPGVIPGLNLACHVAAHPDSGFYQANSTHPDGGTPPGGGRLTPGGVLVQTPIYPPIYQAAETSGVLHQELALNRLSDGSYQVDWAAFEAAITSETRLFILCNPHNPVGKVFQKWELERTAELCLRHGLVICSDEIHCDLVYREQRHVPIAALDADIAANSITLMAPSKTFNLPGLQCAFAIIPNPELRKQYLRAGRGILAWVGSMGMVAAQAAYQDGQEWLEQLLAYLERNRDCLVEYIQAEMPEIGVGKPAGTYLAWLDCRGAGLDGSSPEKNPQRFFLEKAKVALSEGKPFGGEGQGFVRLNFACPHYRLMDALERMKGALSAR